MGPHKPPNFRENFGAKTRAVEHAVMADTALEMVLAHALRKIGAQSLGSGGLALMIPPSALAVLLGAVGEISIGRILIAIIGPGLLMAILYGDHWDGGLIVLFIRKMAEQSRNEGLRKFTIGASPLIR